MARENKFFGWGIKGQTDGHVDLFGPLDEQEDEYRHLTGGREEGIYSDAPDRNFDGEDSLISLIEEGMTVDEYIPYENLAYIPFVGPIRQREGGIYSIVLATDIEEARKLAEQGIMPVYFTGERGAAVCDPLDLIP